MRTDTKTSDPIGAAIPRAGSRGLWPVPADVGAGYLVRTRSIASLEYFVEAKAGCDRTFSCWVEMDDNARMPRAVEPGNGQRDLGWLFFLGWLHKRAAHRAQLIGDGYGEGLFAPVTN